jgi:hypothetical protein
MDFTMLLNPKNPQWFCPPKVNVTPHGFDGVSDDFPVDIEPEDIDLGNTQGADLAFDVDGDLADEDPEALDSDDDRRVDEELGIEADGCESTS